MTRRMCASGLGPTEMRVLVVNAGSSSLKLRVLGADDAVLATHDLPAEKGRFDERALAGVLRAMPTVDAVGHRIVHGGDAFVHSVGVDARVEERLRRLEDLAPLHQAAGLAALDVASRLLPGVPAVACFDTTFHASLPPEAFTYAVPQEWRERYHVRRYGFHGLSHAYAARRAAQLLSQSADTLRLVICHLGAGASLAAVQAGVSVDTTMGFTPLDGLVMATRSGGIDPGLVLWMQQHADLTAAEVGLALEYGSGLFALAGTGDMQQVLRAAGAGDAAACLAVAVYLHRLRAEVAAMASAMGGCDALVFTGGVGEHATAIRERAASGLAFLGVQVDALRNAAAVGCDADVSAAGARVASLVVVAREDLQIAREVRAVVGAQRGVGRP